MPHSYLRNLDPLSLNHTISLRPSNQITSLSSHAYHVLSYPSPEAPPQSPSSASQGSTPSSSSSSPPRSRISVHHLPEFLEIHPPFPLVYTSEVHHQLRHPELIIIMLLPNSRLLRLADLLRRSFFRLSCCSMATLSASRSFLRHSSCA
jgi:hypothetical protein